jgi:hypothetical protein
MRLKLVGLIVAAAAVPLCILAQNEMQEKMAQVKDGIQANQAALKSFTYQQHTQIFLKGDLKKTENFSVVTGPDGKPQKTSLDPPPPPPEGGRLKRRVVENKVDDMKAYMDQAQQLIAQYVPPNPQKMQAAFSSGAAALSPAGPGIVKLTFTNYVVSGDSMTIEYNTQTKQLAALSVNSYLGEAKDAVTLNVVFAMLPNGLSHVAMTDLVAKAKNIEVKSTNDNYQQM